MRPTGALPPRKSLSPLMYDEGQGVPQDHAKAQWFRKAAAQGHVGAQLNLGLI